MGLPDEAISDYEAIRAKHDLELTLKQRYRIEANIGNALYAQGKMDTAADAYLRAVEFYRESRDAQALEVLAWILRNEKDQALRLEQIARLYAQW